MRCEAGDGCKFPVLYEGLYKCSHQRRAKGLVDVACIFTSRCGVFHVGSNGSGRRDGWVDAGG
jgi:hypothetical protein